MLALAGYRLGKCRLALVLARWLSARSSGVGVADGNPPWLGRRRCGLIEVRPARWATWRIPL